LIGCARSRAIHEWFYGDLPPDTVEMCPRKLFSGDGGPVLTKCCLLENHNEAEVALVGQALTDLATAADPAWAPA
jgi:hypothetical protein